MDDQPILQSQQSGATLVVGLLFLLVLTLLSVAALRGANLQERMAGGVRQSNLSLQSAESALLGGENWLAAQVDPPISGDPLGNNVCDSPCNDSVLLWPVGAGNPMKIDGVDYVLDPFQVNWADTPWRADTDDDDAGWAANARELGENGAQDIPLVQTDPRFLVLEGVPGGSIQGFDLDADGSMNQDDFHIYAVTARGVGIVGFQDSILQTFYVRRF